MHPNTLVCLRQALAEIEREMEALPPFSAERRDLRDDAEVLRAILRRYERRARVA